MSLVCVCIIGERVISTMSLPLNATFLATAQIERERVRMQVRCWVWEEGRREGGREEEKGESEVWDSEKRGGERTEILVKGGVREKKKMRETGL